MKRIASILLFLICVNSLTAQATFQRGSLKWVWAYTRQSNYADYDTAAIKFDYTNSGKWWIRLFDLTGSEIFRIDTLANTYISGKLGVGAYPQNKLDVEGGAVIGATYSGTNTAPSNGLLVEGNVGIGTTSPGAKLGVNGGTVKIAGSSTAYLSDATQLEFSPTGTAERGLLGYDSDSNVLSLAGYAASILYGKYTITYPGDHQFSSNGSGALVTIKNDGKVGIGTTSPKNKLDIEGGAVIGATYSGTNTAPSNGLLVEGNVGIGTTALGTNAAKVLGLGNGTAPISCPSNIIQIWAEDYNSLSELIAMGEDGIKYPLTVTDHCFIAFEDSSVGIGGVQNTWYQITNVTDSLWGQIEVGNGFTCVDDTIIYSGYANAHISFTMSLSGHAGAEENWEFRIYNVTDGAGLLAKSETTGLGADDRVSISVVAYDINATIGDKYILQAKNTTNGNQFTFENGSILATVTHY